MHGGVVEVESMWTLADLGKTTMGMLVARMSKQSV